MSLMVSISGIRGIVGGSLTPETIVKYAAAFAEYCKRGTVIIGRDGRVTGKSIGHIISSTLLQMGCDVVGIGVCPTPTVQLAVQLKKAAGGICVTASHNPMEWNGLKFISPTGLFLDADENQAFWNIADRQPRSYAPWNKQGSHSADFGLVDEHIKNVLSLSYLDVTQIRQRQFRVVVDCVNAAGGVIIPKLLREFGCRVIEMGCDVSGIFSHSPEPIPENLSDICSRVREEKADIGVVVDPDVDRLVLINEKGEPFGEEYTLASAVKFVLERESSRNSPVLLQQDGVSSRQRRDGQSTIRNSKSLKVVTNLSTTRAIDDICKLYNAELTRTEVGEIHVAKKMREIGAIVGGEGNGGVILPESHIGRDAPVGVGLTLQHLTDFGGTLSELKASLPQYSITKGKVELGALNPDEVIKRIQETHRANGRATTIDGLKLDFSDSWIHLRKSNTEPILRIIAEAPQKKRADELVAAFTKEILDK
ncbi:MAG: phosphoglucosamine mutase [Ignavibacteriales bacterium]|nr:phosphoglucosamine mutase [Ignavibacteriales bacterium]